MSDYNIRRAFERIEEELIASMIRNMSNHRAQEDEEGFQWEQWQALQLKELEAYKRRNQKLFGKKFREINEQLELAILKARENGNMEQELELLEMVKSGKIKKPRATKKSMKTNAEFFKINDRKMDALIKATVSDMKRAETAILRMANDKYRKIIFDAQVYANSGAGTYEKAVDMATRDFLAAGLNCVEYKNGARHTLKDYAEMALRTASKRAYLTGEGEKRKEWGIPTVIMNKRGNPCPKCLPWVGKVLIDDVWSGGSAKDGDYPLMSTAIAANLYHPRCKDHHTTYLEGISTPPDDKFTKGEIKQIEAVNKAEAKKQYAQRQAEKFERLAEHSLDSDNMERYKSLAGQWGTRSVENHSVYANKPLEYDGESGTIKLGLNLFDSDDPIYFDTFGIEEEPGFKDIYMHGSPDSVQMKVDGKLKNFTAQEFAEYLREHGYGSEDIRLGACSSGAGENSFAQELSRILGVRVKAPDSDAYYDPSAGVIFVGSPHRNVGRWRVFNNGEEE